MNNKQLRSLAKRDVRLPTPTHTDRTTGKVALNPYFVANPNAYTRRDAARVVLASHGF